MFNDLNSQQNNRQPIDDIFAETDKPGANQGTGIETHRVGLTTTEEGSEPLITNEEPEKSSKPLWLKIIPLVIILSILILAGYLVYSKYFVSTPPAVVEKTPVKTATTTENTNTNSDTNTNGTMIPSSAATSSDTVVPNPSYVSEIPGLNSTTTVDTITPPAVVSNVDSDSDGLTDEEEKIYQTNPMAVDTDSDGLSDYEEVKKYKTNPLLPDTDGDSYLDGAEVKSDYNPNGAGKMPGVESPTVTQ